LQVLQALAGDRTLRPESRSRLLAWLRETPTGPNRLQAGVPRGVVVAHKTGTDRTVDGMTRATNDIGLVPLPDGGSVAIAVFVADSRAGVAAREGAIAGVARAVWRCCAREAGR
jgi:beta-lactamase class A